MCSSTARPSSSPPCIGDRGLDLGSGTAVVDAQLRHGAHARSPGAGWWTGSASGSCWPWARRSRRHSPSRAASVHSLVRGRGIPAARWHGRRRAAIPRAVASWSAGFHRSSADWSWESAQTATPAGSRPGRPGDPPCRRKPRSGHRIAVPRRGVRAVRGGLRGRRTGPATPTARLRRRRSTWPTRTADPRCWGAFTPSRCCWSSRRAFVWTFTLVWLMTERGWSGGVGGRDGHRFAGSGRRWAHRGRAMVRCGRLAPAAHPHHRRWPPP